MSRWIKGASMVVCSVCNEMKAVVHQHLGECIAIFGNMYYVFFALVTEDFTEVSGFFGIHVCQETALSTVGPHFVDCVCVLSVVHDNTIVRILDDFVFCDGVGMNVGHVGTTRCRNVCDVCHETRVDILDKNLETNPR
jgi:hypothetical protein